jgi:hypothetical protein
VWRFEQGQWRLASIGGLRAASQVVASSSSGSDKSGAKSAKGGPRKTKDEATKSNPDASRRGQREVMQH